MNSPTVSVILPSYNHARYLMASANSVLAQSFRDFELIVIDDASTDGSRTVLEQLRNIDPARVKTVFLDQNIGGPAVINEGIRMARGKYIALCNSDDEWLPNKLADQVHFLDTNPGVGAVFSDVIWIDSTGEEIITPPLDNIFYQHNRSREQWLRTLLTTGNCLCHPSSLIRKEVHDACGAYDPRYRQLHDYELWLRICQQFEIFVTLEPTIRFRFFTDQSNASGITPSNSVRDTNERFSIFSNFLMKMTTEELAGIFGTIKSIDDPDFCFPLEKSLALLGSCANFRPIVDQIALTDLYALSLGSDFRKTLKAYGLPEKFVDTIAGIRHPWTHHSGKYSSAERALVQKMESWCDENFAGDQQFCTLGFEDYQTELSEVLASFSWRVTRGLREANAIIRGGVKETEIEDLDGFSDRISSDATFCKSALKKIKVSKSWKLTAPLRAISEVNNKKLEHSTESTLQLALFDDKLFDSNEGFRQAEIASLSIWFPQKKLYYSPTSNQSLYEAFDNVTKNNRKAECPFIDGIHNPQMTLEADLALCISPSLGARLKDYFEKNDVLFAVSVFTYDEQFFGLSIAEQNAIVLKLASSAHFAGLYTDNKEFFTRVKPSLSGKTIAYTGHNPIPSHLCAPVPKPATSKSQSQILVLNGTLDDLQGDSSFANTIQKETGGQCRIIMLQRGKEFSRQASKIESGGVEVVVCPDFQYAFDHFGQPDALVIMQNGSNTGWATFIANSAAVRKVPVISMQKLSALPCEIPNHLLHQPANVGETVHLLRNILRGRSQKKMQQPNIARFQARFDWKAAQRERTNFFESITSSDRYRKTENQSEKFSVKLAGKYAL